MKRFSVIILILMVFFSGCQNKKESTLKIACNMPMTGDLGYLGEQVQRGLLWALEQNEDSLKHWGCHISIDFQDNEGLAKNAMSIFQKQSLSHPDIYMSGVTSQTMSLVEAVKAQNYPHYIWSFTPLHLVQEDNMFRSWLNLGIEADQYVRIISEKKCKKVAFAYVDIIGCKQQCEDYVIPKIKSIMPDCRIEAIPYPVESTDMKNFVLKIKDIDPDLIIINGFKNHLINMINYLHSYNLVKDNNIVGSFDLLDAATELSATELEGITVSVPFFLTEGSTQRFKEWEQSFENKFGKKPDYTEAYAYDCGMILIEAVKKVKKTGVGVKDAFFDTDIEGITGRLHFMDNGDLEVPIVLCSFKDHQLIPVE